MRFLSWILALGFIALVVWAIASPLDRYGYDAMLADVREHLTMVLIASGIATAIGVTLGVLLTRPRVQRYSGVIMVPVYLGQTIPSLAVIAIALPLVGAGLKGALFALIIYGLLPIVRNTYAGVSGIDPSIIESAQGMGMTRAQIFRKIEIPLAIPVIMAGIRISVVITVGTATLAALLAAGGLGTPIFTGLNFFQRSWGLPLLAKGAILTAALAVLVDTGLGYIESRLTPKGVKVEATRGQQAA